jgi:hypothetical protein
MTPSDATLSLPGEHISQSKNFPISIGASPHDSGGGLLIMCSCGEGNGRIDVLEGDYLGSRRPR